MVEVGTPGKAGAGSNSGSPIGPGAAALTAGAVTMIALCFSNGLQAGETQTFAQSTEALKHTFHVTDAALGVVPFVAVVAANLGGVPVAALCSRFRRTRVLAAMFTVWGVLMALTALVPNFGIVGFAVGGFLLFTLLRIGTSLAEATDPATLPLIADYWPVEQRASKVGLFNALAAVGAFIGLGVGGVVVDNFGWRWAFAMWLPIGLVAGAMMQSRREPVRGIQDAAYGRRLVDAMDPEEIRADPILAELVDTETASVRPHQATHVVGGRWAVVRDVARLRTWRFGAAGLAVAFIMLNGLQFWGIAYFKRTFHLSGTATAGLAPLLGVGTFVGILGGGFLADRLLNRGVVSARVYIAIVGYLGAGIVLMAAFSMTHLVLAATLLGVGSAFASLPSGPQYALLMDVTPASLRSQASAATNVLQAVSAIGPLIVGGLSTLFGNLRLALLCVSPFYLVAGVLFILSKRSYVEDVASVVADAEANVGPNPAGGGLPTRI